VVPKHPQASIVEHVDILRILRHEMEVAVGLTGVTDVSALSRSALVDDGVGYLHNP
jgi:isopentenyl diphosphate isomerase/L-lactate dehydrogenase-like FMN-dependent dehydrogenase